VSGNRELIKNKKKQDKRTAKDEASTRRISGRHEASEVRVR